MIKIFAKLNTSEKIVMECHHMNIKHYQNVLGGMFGGDWIPVDDLGTGSDILKFDDGLVYQGYHGRKGRYCKNIITSPET